MADIQNKILSKYDIDIAQENIFKLYKIESDDISQQDLEKKIQETHKRWTTSINGANVKNAERDKKRLEKADKYEAILRDEKLRKEVYAFFNRAAGDRKLGDLPWEESTEFAREYFELVATTKRIKKSDVDFFFKYYQSERKNKKNILEMLSKEMKINGLGKEDKYANEDDTIEAEGKKKDDTSPLIVNLFQEATVLKIKRANEKYEEATRSNELCQRYPKLRAGLFEFLEIKDIDNAKQFTKMMSTKGNEVYAIRQEKGVDYVPLVDLFNILQDVGEYQDVVDNISEFKLLLKYPNLTPYMFSFVEMKPSTIRGMIDVANRDYSFRDDADFILNYYNPVHDNFGISDVGIGGILRKAEKKAKQNKVLRDIDEKLGINRNRRKIPLDAGIIHWLVYWPIFVVYFVFEVVKSIFTELRRLAIPVFVVLFFFENCWFQKMGWENILFLKKLFNTDEWIPFVENLYGESGIRWFEVILISLMIIIVLLAVFIIPPLFVAFFISEFADVFNKNFDWTGKERTFQNIFLTLRKKTEDEYFAQRKRFIKKKTPKIIINFLCLLILIAFIVFLRVGTRKLGESTGYALRENRIETRVINDGW